MLWWTSLRQDKHARFLSVRLIAQAIFLLIASALVLEVLKMLNIRTTYEAILAGVAVFIIWLIFSFYMRHDLLGRSSIRKMA